MIWEHVSGREHDVRACFWCILGRHALRTHVCVTVLLLCCFSLIVPSRECERYCVTAHKCFRLTVPSVESMRYCVLLLSGVSVIQSQHRVYMLLCVTALWYFSHTVPSRECEHYCVTAHKCFGLTVPIVECMRYCVLLLSGVSVLQSQHRVCMLLCVTALWCFSRTVPSRESIYPGLAAN